MEERGLVMGRDYEQIAINHDPASVETLRLNHPKAQILEDDLEEKHPRDVLPRCKKTGKPRRITRLTASPPCQDYSVAAGGRPKNRQRRATVFYILKWLRWGRPLWACFENVKEFLKTREYARLLRGIEALRKVGLHYSVEARVINSADHGGAQRRERAFIQVALNYAPITWPTATHSDPSKPAPRTLPWRGGIEVLDLDEPAESVFGRKKPLVIKTRRRLARGIREQWGRFWEPLAQAVETLSGPVPLSRLLEAAPPEAWPNQFLVKYRGTSSYSPGGLPLPTITDGGTHLAIADLALVLGQQGGATPRPVDQPMPTIPTAGFLRVIGVDFVVPSLGRFQNRDENGDPASNAPQATADPLNTIVAGKVSAHVAQARFELRPYLVPRHGERPTQTPRYHDSNAPLPTIACSAEPRLAQLVMVVAYNGNRGEGPRTYPATRALPTVTAERLAVAQALFEVSADDILVHLTLRPCKWRELARGQGFPDSYLFHGPVGQKRKQIGNAVHVAVSKAIFQAATLGDAARDMRLSDYAGGSAV